MNVALLRFLLTKVKNPREVLLLWVKATELYPHFPKPLRLIFETNKDEILDCVLASHPDLWAEPESTNQYISNATQVARSNLMTEKFCIDPLADYVYLVWAEMLLLREPKNFKVLEQKEKIFSFWSKVDF